MEEQRKTVKKTFWPKDILNTNSGIPCSSLMGLSARDLRDRSYRRKPLFEEVWKKGAVGYHVRGHRKAGAESPLVHCQNSRGRRPASCL